MNIIIQKGGVLLLLGMLLSPHIALIAQEEIIEEEQTEYVSGLSQGNLEGGSLASCLEYYDFNNIEFNITQDRISYEPGEAIIITGQITNTRNFVLPKVNITAQIKKIIANTNEYILIDEINLLENTSFEANGSKEVNTIYQLSTLATKGQYEIHLFATQNNQFNLSGSGSSSFSRIPFEITGDNTTESLYLDQTRVAVDGKSLQEWQGQEDRKIENVEISIPLKNPLNEEQIIDVIYTDYIKNREEIQATEIEEVRIPAQGEIILKRTLEKLTDAGYTLKLEAKPVIEENSAQWQKALSYIELSGQGPITVTSLGMTTFPKARGEEGQVITCISGFGEGMTIQTRVTNKTGKEIAKSTYTGDVNSVVDAIVTPLESNKAYSNLLTINTKITDSTGAIIDEANIVYDCNEINPEKCIVDNRRILNIIGILVLITLVIGGGYVIYVKKNILRNIVMKKK